MIGHTGGKKKAVLAFRVFCVFFFFGVFCGFCCFLFLFLHGDSSMDAAIQFSSLMHSVVMTDVCHCIR